MTEMWVMEIKVSRPRLCGHGEELVWEQVRPTGCPPYRFETKEQAQKMLEMCYGAVCTKETARVRKEGELL